jgi:hypothetical protein
MTHQFSLFKWTPPKAKIPISSERIKEAKACIAARNVKGAVVALRELREGLENYERRISNGKL